MSGEADPRGHTSHCKISGQRDRVALYRDTEIGFDGEETNQVRSKDLAKRSEQPKRMFSRPNIISLPKRALPID